MKLRKLYITNPGAHVDGTYQTMLDTANGWALVISTEHQAVLATKGTETHWIPFAACRNGITEQAVEAPALAGQSLSCTECGKVCLNVAGLKAHARSHLTGAVADAD